MESQIGMLASQRRGRGGPHPLAARRRTSTASDLAKVFAWLRPNDLVWNYWVNNYLLGQNPPAFDILYWNADTTRLPAGLHSDFLDLYLTNGLVEGTLTVLGTPVDLGKVDVDTYVVAGSTDHIVPWQTAYRTTQLLGGETRVRAELERSHPGDRQPAGQPEGVVPHPARRPTARRRRRGSTAPTATPASWWDHWTAWLAARSGDEAPAPATLGSAAHPPLDPAPGRYVHLR